MKKQDPFADMGKRIYGERFVGRKDNVDRLQQYCTSRLFSIVGLPRIGKTSLAMHSIIKNKDKIYSEKKLCTLFFDVGICGNKTDFFKSLLQDVYDELIDIIEDEEVKLLDRYYNRIKENNFDIRSIPSFFSRLNRFNTNIVIVFDEFDNVTDIGFTKNEYGLLREILHSEGVYGVITSKRTIQVLEYWNDKSSGSNFFQSFDGNTIYLKGFDDDSLDEYWKRLAPYFKDKEIEIDESYKNKTEYYVGRHPHLLDIYNSTIYGATEDVDILVRTEMRKSFDYMVKILSEINLLNAAIQAILGPVYDVNQDDIDLLIQYDFLKKVSFAEKEKLLGKNMGYVVKDDKANKYSYIAFSKYFTLLMHNRFINNFDFWKEWSEVFTSLRMLMEKFVIDNWGEDWEQNDDLDEILKKLQNFRNKDIDSNIEPSPLLGYLQESMIFDLLMKYWDIFKKVFIPWKKDEFKERYFYVIKIRNHYGHINTGSLSDMDKSKANLYLNEIFERLKEWFKNEENLKIVINNIKRGTISENYSGKKIIKWNSKYLPIRSPYDDNLNEYDSVEFELGEEPNKYDSSKPFNYAFNVRKI